MSMRVICVRDVRLDIVMRAFELTPGYWARVGDMLNSGGLPKTARDGT